MCVCVCVFSKETDKVPPKNGPYPRLKAIHYFPAINKSAKDIQRATCSEYTKYTSQQITHPEHWVYIPKIKKKG